MNRSTICLALATATLSFGVARLASAAATINYTVTGVVPTNHPGNPVPYGAPHSPISEGGDGLGYPGDAVGLATYTGTLTLTPGTYTQKVNTLTWDVSYTYNGTDNNLANDGPGNDWPELQFPIIADRTISFGGGPADALSQSGLLRSTWDDDFLGMSNGSTTAYFVPGYEIDVTPLSLPEADVSVFDSGSAVNPQPNRDLMATFVVTEIVPEPASLALLSLSAAALIGRRRKI